MCESLADLVQDHLQFQGLHVIPEAEDELVTLGRLVEFRCVSCSVNAVYPIQYVAKKLFTQKASFLAGS